MTTIIPLQPTLALYERRERITNAMWAIGITKVRAVQLHIDGADDATMENDADLAAATSATITHR